MVGLAARVADGYITHPTNSNPRYLDEICLPALAERPAGMRPIDVVAYASIVTAPTAAGLVEARERQRFATAFLYTTPAYARSLELHGFTDLAERLRTMVRAGDWDRLGEVVTDDVLDALTLSATWDGLPDAVAGWYTGRAGAVIVPLHDDRAGDGGTDGRFAEVVRAIRALGDAPG
jgi:hypothetical protein